MKKLLIFFITTLILINGIFALIIPSDTGTTGTTTGTSTGSSTGITGEVPRVGVFKPETYTSIGKLIGKDLNDNDIQIKDNGDFDNKNDFISMYKETGSSVSTLKADHDFGVKISKGVSSTSETIQYDEYSGFMRGQTNSIAINDKKEIVKIDVKIDDDKKRTDGTLEPGEKAGSNLVIGGKEFNAPEGSRVLMDDKDKTSPIKIDLKQGTKILTEPKKREKKDEEEERNLQYRSLQGFAGLPDSIAQQMGFSGKPVEFKGIFSHNGDNWFLDKQHTLTLKIDGKEIPMQNLYNFQVTDNSGKLRTLLNVNERADIFFSRENFNNALNNGYKGGYFIFDKQGVGGGTNNEQLAGHSIKIPANNPWGINIAENSHVAAWSLKDSNYFFTKDSQIISNGKVVIDNDYIYYRTDPDTNKIHFNQGSKVPGFGEAIKFKDSLNSPLDLIPFKKEGEAFPFKSKVVIGKSTNPSPNNPSNFKVVPMQGSEEQISRVIFGEMPKDSRRRTVSPVIKPPETPVQPNPPQSDCPPDKPDCKCGPEGCGPKLLPKGGYIPNTINWADPSNWGKCTGTECKNGDYSKIFEKYAISNKQFGGAYDPTKQTKGVLIKIGADWCPGCIATDQGFDAMAKQNQGIVKFAHLNVDNEKASLSQLGIFGNGLPYTIPAVIHLKDGQVSVIRMNQGESQQSFLNKIQALIK